MDRASERRAGDVLDRRYRLVHRLGRGGFGDVWRAEELLPDGAAFRDVALKLLSMGGADVQDWAEEAKLLASFRHPSLVTIYAAGILETKPPQRFVAMELLEGQNLADLIRERGPVPWRRVLGWGLSTAAALDVIHAAGVVHLDLKPANLFVVAEGGALKVLDFGIARRAGSEVQSSASSVRVRVGTTKASDAELPTAAIGDADAFGATAAMGDADAFGVTAAMSAPDVFGATADLGSAGARLEVTRPAQRGKPKVVVGSPGFVAPEVLELAEPTAAADAYALGVCMVQLVTGRLPYDAPEEPSSWQEASAVSAWLETLCDATVRGKLRDFEREAELPRALGQLLRRLLSRSPRERGVSAGKLRELFEEVWQRPHGVPDPPYFSLDTYPPVAEGVLFGRDDDIARLGRELCFEPTLLLEGPRGAGKSSLVNAGLVPELGRRAVDGKDDWVLVRVNPGEDPDAALDVALAEIDAELVGKEQAELAARALASKLGFAVVVDRLEDALGAPPERRARFDAFIASATARLCPGLRLIAVLAEEHAQELSDDPELGPVLRPLRRFVGMPAATAARDIVFGPPHYAGVSVGKLEAVSSEVQRELGSSGACLAQVSLTLAAWWRARGAGTLGGAEWKEMGGFSGALAMHGDRVLEAMSVDERMIAEELLLRITSEGARTHPYAEEELTAGLGRHEQHVQALVAKLERATLVRRQGDKVLIGHELLVTGWTWLSNARLSHFNRLFLLERVREAAIAWEASEEDPKLLVGRALLRELDKRREWTARAFGPRELSFLRASRKRARLVHIRRVLGFAAIVALILGVLGSKHKLEAARAAEAEARRSSLEQQRIAELSAKSRRVEDHYVRAAYIAAAMELGSSDAMLPLDLMNVTGEAARASFLSLDEIMGPEFPWDDRWLVGQSSGSTLVVVDFEPNDPNVFDDLAIDADLEVIKVKTRKRPKLSALRLHADPIAERAYFAFDTSMVTRSVTGEVKVLRLGDEGPSVAAIAPMRCSGAVRLSARAPVIACATDEGIARWDLRETGDRAVVRHAFGGSVSDISADGSLITALEGSRVLLWEPETGREATYEAESSVLLSKWSERGRLIALVEDGRFEIVDFDAVLKGVDAKLFGRASLTSPVSAHWDAGGLDLGICDQERKGQFYYLRRGGRAREDKPPSGDPCSAVGEAHRPKRINDLNDYNGIVEVATRSLKGGYRLEDGRFISRELLLFDPELGVSASKLLRFEGHVDSGATESVGAGDSVVAVVRDDDALVMQVGTQIRVYTLPEGKRLLAKTGHLLRHCEGGHVLAWRAEGEQYHLFDVWTGAELGVLPREPGFVLGVNSVCSSLYTQRLDGTLVETTFFPGGHGEPRVLSVADGYVFDVREASGPSLLLSTSSGAIARLSEVGGRVELLGYATPRASALGEGARPGDVIYADATGLVLLRGEGGSEQLFEGSGDRPWEDLSVSADGSSMLLLSVDRIAAFDLLRREVLGWSSLEGKTRLMRWDDEGSLLAWSFDRRGGPEGVIIPRGKTLAREVAKAMSNLEVEDGRLVIKH